MAQVAEEAILKYFSDGYTYKEIIGALLINHAVLVNVRQVKYLLKKRGLRRRSDEAPLEQIISALLDEAEGIGCCLGYRALWKKLQMEHGLRVKRDTVMQCMRFVDAQGVQQRRKRRLNRRNYHAKGPNWIWHCDGYDKLKPYGFAIHGAIDGWSRKILWLEVAATNNNPIVVPSTTCSVLASKKEYRT